MPLKVKRERSWLSSLPSNTTTPVLYLILAACFCLISSGIIIELSLSSGNSGLKPLTNNVLAIKCNCSVLLH